MMRSSFVFYALAAVALASGCGPDITFDEGARDLLADYDPNTPDASDADVSDTATVDASSDAPGPLDGLGHGAWDGVLGTFVRGQCFDYASLQTSREGVALLQLYVDQLSRVDLASDAMSVEARVAMWVNAYNALVVFGVLSELENDPAFRVDVDDFIFFKNRRFNVGGMVLSLDLIEHGILRNDAGHPSMVDLDDAAFKALVMDEALKVGTFDARIHFAVNCASTSCPPIRAEAYLAERFDAQLEEQALLFLEDSTKGAGGDGVSMLFSWFQSDFEQNGTVDDFIAAHRAEGLTGVDTGKFLTYDWSLNQYDPNLPICQDP